MSKIQALRGMSDLLPAQTPAWQYFESVVNQVLQSYGYQEIRFPVLEETDLFCRSIGEVTDIVEKEMYTFNDREKKKISLRPEGTASCVRACEQHGLLYNQTQRLWYAGPMFRHERPQKGRLRQFHQVGIEAFGFEGPDIDAEVIIITAKLWRKLGILDAVTLHINNLGSPQARAEFRAALVEFLNTHKDQLDEDSQRRIATNPLRVLDSKVEKTQQLLDNAPSLSDFIDSESREHFAVLQELLNAAGVDFVVNSRLVRGLDYYTGTVFEWITDKLGAQGTVCGGGRYDGLVEQLGGRSTPGIGCAMGIERLVLMLEELNCVPEHVYKSVDIYVVAPGDVSAQALALTENLRLTLPQLRIVNHCGGGNFKSQFKKADKSGATLALIVGESEVQNKQAGIKFLREKREQITVNWNDLATELNALLSY